MKNLENSRNKIPSDHYKFLKICREKVQKALGMVPDGMMLPPVIFLLSENNKMTHMSYDVNMLHENYKAFEDKYTKIDKNLLEKGFDTAMYVCVSEANLKTADERFKEELKRKNIDFNNLSSDDYEMLANASKKLEVKDVVFMSAFTLGYTYIVTFDRKTKEMIDDNMIFDSSKGRVSDVFNNILQRKLNYDLGEF